MLPIITIILYALAGGAAGGVLTATIIALFEKIFSNKKTLLTGPISSGKTTFLQYISKENIPDGPSGAPRTYKVGSALFDEVTDFSGAEAWLNAKFDEYIEEHDYIIFFFDISKYIEDYKYRVNSNARIDMIHRNSQPSQTVLLVGTHIDKAPSNYKSEVEKLFAEKRFKSRLNKMVYINTTQKECVKTILNELEK